MKERETERERQRERQREREDFVVVVLLFYVHGKHLWSCRDDQLT